ncbi:MAG: histidine triad nucleotide-binding protein [Betaproteobacteria bacterium]|nr:histidine triad nucleotide-binding protein [Betaproteobacteria bacterium]
MQDCIFCKIVRGEIPSRKVYEDDDLLAFHDVRPQAPVHFMIIPKAHVDSLDQCEAAHQELLGKILLLTSRLAQEQGSPDGYRTIVNTGRVGRQEVYHLHVHVLGGTAPLGVMVAPL